MMRGNVRRKKKSSSLSIKIKPFTKPPTLPANFYPSSSAVLFSSLYAILHRQSTLSPSLSMLDSGRDSPTTTTANNEMQIDMPSREELYGKVQDLCTHGFGPKLYKELIKVLDQSAFQCASRLAQYQTHDEHGQAHAHGAAAVYPTMNFILKLMLTAMAMAIGYILSHYKKKYPRRKEASFYKTHGPSMMSTFNSSIALETFFYPWIDCVCTFRPERDRWKEGFFPEIHRGLLPLAVTTVPKQRQQPQQQKIKSKRILLLTLKMSVSLI